MPTARFLILTLLLAAPAAAQQRLPNELASAMRVEAGPAPAFTPAPAPTVSLPEAPTPHKVKVIDKKFVAVMGALGGAESLRFTSRTLVVEREFAAGAPWITSVPRNVDTIRKDGALFAAELLVAYELKKPHSWLPGDKVIRRLWFAYPATMTAIHTKNAIGNIRTQGPGGCTSIQCAEQTQQ